MRGISDLIDSDMENAPGFIDENSILSSASDGSAADRRRETSQIKKPRKRHRVTMPKSKTRVTKSAEDVPTKKGGKKATGVRRKALEEQINGASADANIIESIEAENNSVKKVAKSKASELREPTVEDEAEDMEIEQTPLAARSSFAQTKKGAPKVTARTVAPKVHKKIQKPVVTDLGPEQADTGDVSEVAPLPPSRPQSKIRTESMVRRRAGSASDTERGDPNLRRRLGDMTRKFENIDLKYHNLREVGINEASANVEKLRRQCEVNTQASNELIASLKKELSSQTPIASESRRLTKVLQSCESEVAALQSREAELSSSLAAAQNEIRTLQAKLAASRSASVGAEPSTSKTPGSIPKGTAPVRTVMVGTAEVAQAAQIAQMKEDLYSDLTGLIIRGVKRTDEGDTFDCIQTGRNGTLHFKLYIDQEDAKSSSFEETEFLYTPLLDASRDREMIDLMPEYLTEDITFARQNAAKFYARVVDTLTRRRSEE